MVCGYGRNGNQAIQKLMAYKQSFVIIELNEEIVDKYSEDHLLLIQGNTSEDEVLIKAGIRKQAH